MSLIVTPIGLELGQETPRQLIERLELKVLARAFSDEELKLLRYHLRYIQDIVNSKSTDDKADCRKPYDR